MLSLGKIMDTLNLLAPWELAEDWDRVGLQIGRPEQKAHRILTALDMNERVLEEGLDRKVDGFIVHHPFFFQPLTRVDTGAPQGHILARMLKKDLFLIAAHTNMDKAVAGLNQYLAELLELRNIETLEPVTVVDYKIVVFVPEADAPRLRRAMAAAGAGRIGDYTECAFLTPGSGSFIPGTAAHPTLGQNGALNEVKEIRLEMQTAAANIDRVLQTVRQLHPYEEPVVDVYPLEPRFSRGIAAGLGRIGQLPQEMTWDCFCQRVKEVFQVSAIRVSGPPDKTVNRVALCSGSGGSIFRKAVHQKADVYLTGEFHYHDYLTAAEEGLSIIEAGHWGTEHHFAPLVTRFFESTFEKDVIEVINSDSIREEPFKSL